MIIRENYIGMDPIKLKGIAEWPEPSTVKGVRSFLGFGNFYRKFIANFSDIDKPLTNLMRTAAGSPPFEWTTECQMTFDTLKQRFSTAPVLLLPDKAKPFIVESDASKFATSAVLRQADINGDLHPCAYISQMLNSAERKSTTANSLESFEPSLNGAIILKALPIPSKFAVITRTSHTSVQLRS
ncbi:hypothetical protein SCP_0211780 [Sparassis crispa]|uniref:Reverse transcriptase/retrotransposon-derived protein RNase H-like domain-containing protein n=1 Tax=Sparassis crispa TaxID=139825 RepID=A0A401GCR3_9APHY|nr:hypothetical protein SCP_0211780 [Sparassis crispa]GBE79976.1 hypothetical protein SCP_0211780 [Sparassis crispa]